MTMPKVIAGLLLCIWLTMGLSGCMFVRLSKDLKQAEDKVAFIRGRVSYAPDGEAPVLMLLFTNEGQKAIVDFTVLERPGLYAFLVPRGTYYVAGFIDDNRNMRPDVGETFGVYGGGPPEPVVISEAGTVNGIHLALDRIISEDNIDVAFWANKVLEESSASTYIRGAGLLADLDHPHFSPQYAEKGLWQPYATLREVGIGLYFLEDYDPQKIPVLFVYGASGHAQNWRVLFEGLDREHFQPWFFNYPSGLDLRFIGNTLNGTIQWLHQSYAFDTLFIVAHSMGGLVSRYAILDNIAEDENDYIKLFVTISTPWGGHRAAAKGVQHAPAVVPSWRDMVPDSEFIGGLYSQELPDTIPHYVFFSYSGRSGMMNENNDGAVTLASQLDYRVQRQAREIYGFDEDHVKVLHSEDVVAIFNGILRERAEELPQGPLQQLFKGLKTTAPATGIPIHDVYGRGASH